MINTTRWELPRAFGNAYQSQLVHGGMGIFEPQLLLASGENLLRVERK
jgi:hypothetical protein